MAITDTEQGIWLLDQVYNKQNQGDIWEYTGSKEGYSWGQNPAGRLGLNQASPVRKSSPTQIPGQWTTIIGGEGTGFGIKTNGTLWSWGTNDYGELGLNNKTSYSSPKQVGTETTWSRVASARYTVGAVKTDGTLWSWGDGNYGQLGLNQHQPKKSSPTQIGTSTSWSEVSVGYEAMGGLYGNPSTGATLYMWGANEYGMGGWNHGGWNQPNYRRSSPTVIPGSWKQISLGKFVAYGIKSDDTGWAWGRQYNGSLGTGTSNRSSPVALQGTNDNWQMINSGSYYNVNAIKTDGTLWSWGYGGVGQRGDNSSDYSETSPKPIGTNTNWAYIRANTNASYAIKTDGTLWSWGGDSYGQLGLNQTPKYGGASSPTQVGTQTDWNTVFFSHMPGSRCDEQSMFAGRDV